MMFSSPRAFVFVGFMTVCTLMFLALGVWQTQRLYWKGALQQQIDDQAQKPPMNIDAGNVQAMQPWQYIAASGQLAKAPVVFMPRLNRALANKGNYQWGYDVYAPITIHGVVYYARLGWHTEKIALPVTATISVQAVVRPFDRINLFAPRNDPAKDHWFRPDASLYSVAKLPPQPGYFDVMKASPNFGTRPVFEKLVLVNNHQIYAITWFGLAAITVLLTGLWWHKAQRSAIAKGAE